ncbi:hypothetical protein [Curtobacterium sp. MCSS17_006]|nr:hypothetical protein [Curtobacterium sp. MCSS17_006]
MSLRPTTTVRVNGTVYVTDESHPDGDPIALLDVRDLGEDD